MLSRSAQTILLISIIGLCAAASVFLTRASERVKPPLPQGYEDDDLSVEANKMKGFVFGAEGLISDWYWMNSLQYIGGKIENVGLNNLNLDDMSALNPRLLYPYLKNTTDLDPHFIAAYSYGATVLPAIDVPAAIELTQKGIDNNPDNWRLYHYLGYIYWREKDYEKASEVYSKGSAIEGAAPFMKEMAASMKTKGGSRDTARQMYLQIQAEAEDQQSRDNADLRLKEIDSLDERDAMNEVLLSRKDSDGKCPGALNAIIPELRRVTLPRNRNFSVDASGALVDPLGFPYRLDEKTCTAALDPKSRIPRTTQ